MRYETYWSILDLPTNSIKSYSVFFIIALVSIVTWLLIKKFKKSTEDYEKPILLWCVGLIFLFTTSMFIYVKFFTIDKTEERINKILTSSKVGKVEGVIKNFNRRIEHKRKATVTLESFEVDSVKFAYANYLLGKFNQFSETNNGVLQNGLRVRITYRKGDFEIQKIEIAKEN